MKYSGWLDLGELVVRRVDDIANFDVSVDLEEYEDKHGLCHVSKIASGWIKDVHDHAREGQAVVAEVLGVNESSQQINLSIKDANEHQCREKIQGWKDKQKADKWMALVFGEDIADDRYQSIANTLLAEFGSLYDDLEQAAIHGIEAFDDVELDDDKLETIVETACQNASVPYVNVTGYVDLRSPAGNGVDDVRETLRAAEGDGEIGDEIELSVTYVGVPEHRVKVKVPDYKTAETELESSVARAREAIEVAGGAAEYHREHSGDEG